MYQLIKKEEAALNLLADRPRYGRGAARSGEKSSGWIATAKDTSVALPGIWRRPGEISGQLPLGTTGHTNDMATAKPRLYSVRQAAAMAGVSEKTIRRWIKRGLLPSRQPGGPRSDLLIDGHDLSTMYKKMRR